MLREIKFLCLERSAEDFADMMMDAGAMSVSIEDADLGSPDERPLYGEPGTEPDTFAWNRSIVSVLADETFDATQAAAIAAGQGVPRPSDIGKLNGRPFVYVAAFGAFTKVAYETPQDLKNTFGHLAYVMAGIASLPSITPYHMKIEYDGNTLEDDFYFGMVSNAYSIGGIRLPTSEHVVLDDGLFEVDLVKKPVSLADVANGFQALLDQNQPSAGSRIHFKASHLTFTCEQPIPWTIDGEFGGSESVNEIVNCQRALTIIRGS